MTLILVGVPQDVVRRSRDVSRILDKTFPKPVFPTLKIRISYNLNFNEHHSFIDVLRLPNRIIFYKGFNDKCIIGSEFAPYIRHIFG